MIVKSSLPQSAGHICAEAPGRSALEESHEIDKGFLDIERQNVDVVRHDAVAKDAPGLSVKAADFGGDEVGKSGICENRTPGMSASGQEGLGT